MSLESQEMKRSVNKDYEGYNVPKVYFRENPKKLRQNMRDYDYKGNF